MAKFIHEKRTASSAPQPPPAVRHRPDSHIALQLFKILSRCSLQNRFFKSCSKMTNTAESIRRRRLVAVLEIVSNWPLRYARIRDVELSWKTWRDYLACPREDMEVYQYSAIYSIFCEWGNCAEELVMRIEYEFFLWLVKREESGIDVAIKRPIRVCKRLTKSCKQNFPCSPSNRR